VVIEVSSPGPGRACCSTTAGSAGWRLVGHSEVVFATRATGLPLLLRPAATLQRAPLKELSQVSTSVRRKAVEIGLEIVLQLLLRGSTLEIAQEKG
jgi:hypothetical protein